MNDLYSKQIGETLAETLSELFAIDDLGIPLNEIRDLKTLQGHMETAKAKYGVKHPKYKALQNLHAKKTAAEARKAERMARIKSRQEYHAKNFGYKRVKGTNTWNHESGHTLSFGDDRSWSHMKSGGKCAKGGGATPIRDLRRHLAKLHEGVIVSGGEELNEIRALEKLRMQANQAILRHDPIAQEKLQRALSLQQRKRNIDVDEDEEQDRAAHSEKLRQDYLAKMKPKRDAEAARSAAADEWTRKHLAASAEAAKKKAAEKHATLEKSKAECPTCKRGGPGPSHEGSPHCRSGSLASGGHRAHCSCDTCY